MDYDGEFMLVNTALRRQKDRNMRRIPQVALAISDPDDPYRYMQVRGTVVEITLEGAEAHIDKMQKKYHGNRHLPEPQPGLAAGDLQDQAGPCVGAIAKYQP